MGWIPTVRWKNSGFLRARSRAFLAVAQSRAGMMMKPSLASNALRRTALKILGEGRHVEVAVCVGENGDVFVGHGFILPVTIALGGGSKSR